MVYEVNRSELTREQWEEMRRIARDNVCAQCGGELQIHTNPEKGTLVVGCLQPGHHGFVQRETWTESYRRGGEVPQVVRERIEKRMLPGGYEVGTALKLIKARFPRAELDDPSAALFLMDCIRLDLDPLLGEIVPVTFQVTDKKSGEVRRVVQPVLTEDGWLSLAARACPERWAGPPLTEPVTDRGLKKELCGEEDAWVWRAKGRTRDGTESIAFGWVKKREHEEAVKARTPMGELPGNQARVRAIKRWVRETFPEAKARMREMTAEWVRRAEEVEEVQRVIEAEYHIVGEEAQDPGPGDQGVEGEGLAIDPTWLTESLKLIRWSEGTLKSFVEARYKVNGRGGVAEVLKRLTREQAEDLVREITSRVESQPRLV